MKETKTAEERPDFEGEGMHKAIEYVSVFKDSNTFDFRSGYTTGCEKTWNDHVSPLKKTIQELEDVHIGDQHIIYDLKKRIEELEVGLLGCQMILTDLGYKAAVKKIEKLFNPSTNGK